MARCKTWYIVYGLSWLCIVIVISISLATLERDDALWAARCRRRMLRLHFGRNLATARRKSSDANRRRFAILRGRDMFSARRVAAMHREKMWRACNPRHISPPDICREITRINTVRAIVCLSHFGHLKTASDAPPPAFAQKHDTVPIVPLNLRRLFIFLSCLFTVRI